MRETHFDKKWCVNSRILSVTNEYVCVSFRFISIHFIYFRFFIFFFSFCPSFFTSSMTFRQLSFGHVFKWCSSFCCYLYWSGKNVFVRTVKCENQKNETILWAQQQHQHNEVFVNSLSLTHINSQAMETVCTVDKKSSYHTFAITKKRRRTE